MAKKNKILDDILASITPERQAEIDLLMDTHIKWMDEHPDYNKRYGTNESYWLETIKSEGFNPVGITTMLCEETIIMATKEEANEAWEIFKPEGWWYSVDEWEGVRKAYVNDGYNGVEEDAPRVYCLDDKYKEIIK